MHKLPTGLALYVRRFNKQRHGTPASLMKRMADHGATWVAIAGPWDDDDGGLRFINKPDVCKSLIMAAKEQKLTPYVWGYPWLDREEQFADAMRACAGTDAHALLDPELGANPRRIAKGSGFAKAEAGAEKLVSLMQDRFSGRICGLSTFGSGLRFPWFPLRAYARALALRFPNQSFIGGQTYTEDKRIDMSISDFASVAFAQNPKLEVVPNFGVYQKTATGYRPKTAAELDVHFLEFIDEGEPVKGMIGWAENFMTPELWKSFQRMSVRMERGATQLK